MAPGRYSRFSRLGTETPRLSVQVSSRNRNRNRLQAKRGLGISLGTETMKLLVSVSEPESGYTASSMKTPKKCFFTVKNCLFSGIGTEMPRLSVVILESDLESELMFRISQTRNRTRNRFTGYFRLGIGTGIDVKDIIDSESDSESKKVEPGISGTDPFYYAVNDIFTSDTSTLEQVNITDPSKPPLKLLFGSIKVQPSRKNSKKMLVNGFRLVLKFFYCPLLYPKVC